MATQRIASASARGAVSSKKKALNNLTTNSRLLVPGASEQANEQAKRWKSTPAIGLDSSVTSKTG